MDDAISHRHRVIASSLHRHRLIASSPSHRTSTNVIGQSLLSSNYRAAVIAFIVASSLHRPKLWWCCSQLPGPVWISLGSTFNTWPRDIPKGLIRCTKTQITKMFHYSVGNKDSQETFPRVHNPYIMHFLAPVRNLSPSFFSKVYLLIQTDMTIEFQDFNHVYCMYFIYQTC